MKINLGDLCDPTDVSCVMTGLGPGDYYYPDYESGDTGSSSSWLSSAINSLSKVAAARLSVPQLNPGQSITYGPGGIVQMTQQPPGVAASGASLTSTANLSGLGSTLPILLAVGAAILLAKR